MICPIMSNIHNPYILQSGFNNLLSGINYIILHSNLMKIRLKKWVQV